MAANVETMVYADETPWHGLGTKIDDSVLFEDAFQKSGLDWEVKTEPLYRANGDLFPNSRAVIRDTDDSVLGSVGSRWTPLQNRDAFSIFEPLIESGDMSLHTAGSLKNGQRVWVLCQLNLDNSQIVPGDEIAKFALLSNGHDGILAVHFGFTPIRVVCSNTEAMARASKASKLIRVRHHRFVKENVEKLRDIMNLANQEFETTAESYRFLASRQINSDDLDKYVRIVFNMQSKADDNIQPLTTRSANIKNEVIRLAIEGQGNNMPGVNGTWWAAYNGVTEYMNYQQGRNGDNRLNSLWFGQNKNLNGIALETALVLAS